MGAFRRSRRASAPALRFRNLEGFTTSTSARVWQWMGRGSGIGCVLPAAQLYVPVGKIAVQPAVLLASPLFYLRFRRPDRRLWHPFLFHLCFLIFKGSFVSTERVCA